MKTWGDVFLDHKRKGEDHGSAALAADEHCRRAGVWTPPEAIRAAHAAGFAGTSWIMGPEELAHLLNVAQKMSNAKVSGAGTASAGLPGYADGDKT